jgi:hypothetical protein
MKCCPQPVTDTLSLAGIELTARCLTKWTRRSDCFPWLDTLEKAKKKADGESIPLG